MDPIVGRGQYTYKVDENWAQVPEWLELKPAAVSVDSDSRVTAFEEKPERPASTLAGIALYFYPREVLPLVSEYLEEGHNPDQPGRFVEWLYLRTPVYAWRVPGRWLDIGTTEALAESDRVFGE